MEKIQELEPLILYFSLNCKEISMIDCKVFWGLCLIFLLFHFL